MTKLEKLQKLENAASTSVGPWKGLWLRLKKNKLALTGLFILLFFLLITIISFFANNIPFTAPFFEGTVFDYDVAIQQDLNNTLLKPFSPGAFLGTDALGRDVLARIIYGTRLSMSLGVCSVMISIVIGGFFGSIAGYYGGKIETIIMRATDVLLSLPSILLALAIIAAFGKNFATILISISVPSVAGYIRIIRASFLSLRGQEYVEASRASGAGDVHIIRKHMLPNSLAPIIVQGTLGIAGAILSISGLSFLGFGFPPPTPEWGGMLSEGRQWMRIAPHLTLVPGACIMLVILSLNLLGDGLRDALDPKLKN